MESIIHEELYKNRGFGATLKAAYNMFLTNFTRIFRHIWWAALVFALVLPLSMVANTLMMKSSGSLWWVWVLVALVVVAAEVVFFSRLTMLYNEESWKWNIIRILKLTVVVLFVIVVVAFVFGFTKGLMENWLLADLQEKMKTGADAQAAMAMTASANMKVTAVMLCGLLIFILLLVPLYYTSMKYVVEVKSRLRKILWPSYTKGLRRWGYIFVLLLLTGLVLFPFVLVVCLPLIIMVTSMMLSTNGVLQGDPSGLPGGFMWLYYAVYVLTVFVLTFFTVFELTVIYFMYGSIETREQERQKARELKLMGGEV
ncbi:MAG: hypothetical protein J6X46_04595 [Prevotella sp.]|nr:hypothetical protein [Prevotella sp.]